MKHFVIAATYNQPQDLDRCLDSLLKQSTQDFEIYLADDGSGPETLKVIDKYKKLLGHRLSHFWQEDLGFRKAKILNVALSSLPPESEWLIFLDCDTFVHPRFVEDHIAQKSKNSVFMGRRVDLNPWMSEWIRSHPSFIWKQQQNTKWTLSSDFWQNLLISSFQKDATLHFNRAFRIKNPILRRLLRCDRVPDLLGSNFSICAQLIKKIGGFDESFKQYWGEDGDLYIRARKAGARTYGLKCWAVQFHLWHERRPYDPSLENAYKKRLLELP
jgi:GT2 family glycosyltransferase